MSAGDVDYTATVTGGGPADPYAVRLGLVVAGGTVSGAHFVYEGENGVGPADRGRARRGRRGGRATHGRACDWSTAANPRPAAAPLTHVDHCRSCSTVVDVSRARIESRSDRIHSRPAPAVRLPGGRGYATRDARLEPVAELRRLVDQRAQLEGRIAVSVQELRAAGASWSVVGDVLGVTRSAAQKRYGRDELLHG